MSIEEQLRSDLARAADRAPRRDVQIATLELLGRREQVRRHSIRGAAVAAAAVVALVAVATVPRLTGAAPEPAAPTPRQPERPASLEDLPAGAASGVPWWRAGVLHVDGREIATPYRALVSSGGTTVVGASSPDRGARWFVVAGDRLVPLVDSDRPVQPVVSADGGSVVWAMATGATGRRLVAYDVASGAVRGAEDVTVHPVCCDQGGELVVLGVDTDGRVAYEILGEGAHVWTPGGDDLPVTGLRGRQLEQAGWPGGVQWQARSGDPFGALAGVYAAVDRSGAVQRVGTVPADQLGTWNTDGTAYAYPGQDDGGSAPKAPMTDVWVDHLDGRPTRLLLPEDRTFALVGWESPTSVVLQARDPSDGSGAAGGPPGPVALVRCRADTGACERTADEVSGDVMLPTPR